jgi:hypothetical protein
MNLNKIAGFLLIIQGIWMILDKSVGFGFLVNREAEGLALYSYAVPLMLFGLYMLLHKSKKHNDKDDK